MSRRDRALRAAPWRYWHDGDPIVVELDGAMKAWHFNIVCLPSHDDRLFWTFDASM